MSLEFEDKTPLLELLVIALFKSIESGSPVGNTLLKLVQLDEQPHSQDFLTEISLVQFLFEDGFIQVLKFRECEFRRQQLKSDRLITDLSFETLQRHHEYRLMIKCQARHGGNRKPGSRTRVSGGLDPLIVEFHQSVIGDTDNPFTRITLEIPKGIKLLEIDMGDPVSSFSSRNEA